MNCINHVPVDNDNGTVQLCRTFKPIAKKEHRCYECGRAIQPGEQYLYETFYWEGKFEAHKTCADCWSIRTSFFGAGFTYGHILNDLHEHINIMRGDIGEIHMVCLTQAARKIVCDMIERAWEHHSI